MPLLNFQPRFVGPIERREKLHTIRADRKHPIKVGDTLYLYTGLRHKGARRIIPPVVCSRVEQIVINADGTVKVEGRYLSHLEFEELARCDGFDDAIEMLRFWEGRLPFKGQIIHWRAA